MESSIKVGDDLELTPQMIADGFVYPLVITANKIPPEYFKDHQPYQLPDANQIIGTIESLTVTEDGKLKGTLKMTGNPKYYIPLLNAGVNFTPVGTGKVVDGMITDYELIYYYLQPIPPTTGSSTAPN